jgi:D-3-phosphoglycerate dehydrogenase
MNRKVLVASNWFSKYCSEAKALLLDHGCEIIENETDRALTFEELSPIVSELEGVIAGLEIWSGELLKRAGRLKIIARWGAGYDNIDIEASRQCGIEVTNARGVPSNAVAEFTVALMISGLRGIPQKHTLTHQGVWQQVISRELQEKKVGLVGFGSIGKLVAEKLEGFGVRLFAYDPFPDFEAAERLDVTFVPLDELLGSCDIVSLHLPGSKQNRHLFGTENFGRMREGAYFINTSRGNLVEESALHDALVSKRLSGAAIDVYEEEPLDPENPLLQLENIILTPHVAAFTRENFQRVSLVVCKAVIDVFEGREPENLVN